MAEGVAIDCAPPAGRSTLHPLRPGQNQMRSTVITRKITARQIILSVKGSTSMVLSSAFLINAACRPNNIPATIKNMTPPRSSVG